MSLLLTERLIQRQLNHWNRMRAYLHEHPALAADERRRGPVVTVSRLAGSGGRDLAEAVAERLGADLQDQSLITSIAEDKEMERSIVAQLDERTVSQTQLWIHGILQRRLFMKDDFHQALVRVVSTLAARGNVVFLGRGANIILGEQADLRVRVVASERSRIERLCNRTGLARAEARAVLAETDHRRERFVRDVFHTEPGSPENFDLVFNSDRVDTETMVDHVLLALTHAGTHARSALQDQA
jgi:cytidylate kinase